MLRMNVLRSVLIQGLFTNVCQKLVNISRTTSETTFPSLACGSSAVAILRIDAICARCGNNCGMETRLNTFNQQATMIVCVIVVACYCYKPRDKLILFPAGIV